ncbi:MAG: LysE family translocator [Candidatus Thiodiazotropha sp. (ex Myrtea sp. 'scaly one' KF741663)]|nr:LysE family translocator [Candidatus Thiodiazotropha sp. (ex Myrtea sp. 'scaly one' KF741663)]
MTGLFFTAVILALVPGPDNIFVLTQSVILGRWAGLMATLGFSTGLIFHTLAVTLGVAAIFQTSEVAFTLLKFCGAAYLLYLAWRFLQPSAIAAGQSDTARPRPWLLYRRGVIMNVTNPKVSLFFLAFLPQFTDPQAGSVVWQMIVFGLLFIIATLLVFGGLALLAGAISPWLTQKPERMRVINRVAALIFVVLAIRLILAQPF